MKTPSKRTEKKRATANGHSRGAEPEFRTIEPKILYFGTPVALVSSLNEDGTTDLAPISPFWALGWTMTLGLLTETKTAENFERHRECVVNLPSPMMWKQVEKLAPLTGKNPVPETKKKQFHYEPRKFETAELTPLASEVVKPMRAKECPVHMEARVTALHKLSGGKLGELGGGVAAEIEIVRVHVEKNFVLKDNYVDAAKWSPLIYNFRHYFGWRRRNWGRRFGRRREEDAGGGTAERNTPAFSPASPLLVNSCDVRKALRRGQMRMGMMM
ncbi:MAG: flavin reductase family protein [Candidatus Acidiferrum sp.]